MKKQLLTAACALFLYGGCGQRADLVRIGPPPPRPVEVVPDAAARGLGMGPGISPLGRSRLGLGATVTTPIHLIGARSGFEGEWREERGGHVWHPRLLEVDHSVSELCCKRALRSRDQGPALLSAQAIIECCDL